MDTVILDFETYYATDYSLKKLGIMEYVRDPRFKAHGVGIKVNDTPTRWSHDVLEGINSVDWNNALLVGHNLYFDASILFEHYSVVPKKYCDTRYLAKGVFSCDDAADLNSVAKILGFGSKIKGSLDATKGIKDLPPELLDKLGEYCIQDVELTHLIYHRLLPVYEVASPQELELISLTTRMAARPILHVDEATARRALAEAETAQQTALAESPVAKAILASNQQFAKYLTSQGMTVPTKISKTTGKTTFALGQNDPEFIELMAEHPEHQKLWAAREAVKSTIGVTRATKFLKAATMGSKLLPMPLTYYGAKTGRWSGTDGMNVQNLPRGGLLRQSIYAPEGMAIVVVDSSQIELRVNAWFCDHHEVLNTLRSGQCVYRLMASALFNKTPNDVTKQERSFAKAVVLGCLAEDTLVLTKENELAAPSYTPIQYVSLNHLLWDGESWVQHQGLVKKGEKDCVRVQGAWMTPDHKLLCGTTWIPAESVEQNAATLSLALATGSANLPSQDLYSENAVVFYGCSLNVPADETNQKLPRITCEKAHLQDVTHAQRKKPQEHKSNTWDTSTYSQTTTTEKGYSIESARSTTGASTLTTKGIKTTVGEEYPSIATGATVAQISSNTSSHSQVGTSLNSNWTELTTIEDTNLGTSASCLDGPTYKTEPLDSNSCNEYASSRKRLKTYDIALAGPHNRFTIKCDEGHLIAHNCGYGMGANKFKHFCASGPLGMDPIHISDDESRETIRVYRTANRPIADMWYTLDSRIGDMLAENGSTKLKAVEFAYESIVLPNGMALNYEGLHQAESGWFFGKPAKRPLWGGTVLENVIQALARIIVAEQMLEIDRLPDTTVVGMTHDEVLAVCPLEVAEERFNAAIEIMSTPPAWAPDLPLGAEGGWAVNYSK